LIAYCAEPRVFSDREISLVWNFANHAAMAIENATLYARSDERLQEQTRRLEALTQSLADGLILEDLKGNVLYCNRSLCDLAEITIEDVHRLSAQEIRERLIASSPERDTVRTALTQALRERGTRTVEWSIDRGDLPVTLRLNTFAVTDTQGDIVGRGQIIQNITRDRELDRMKTSLITTASHELRTPLAAIKGFATTLLAEDVEWDREAQRKFLTVISQETDRLSALATDLLDLSKIEGGSLVVQCSDSMLSNLIKNSITQVRPTLKQPLNIDIEPDIPLICVDPSRIEAVIRNLIENAIKYGDPKTSIGITAWKNDSHVIVRIDNEGPNIPPEYADRIFEPFFQIDEGFNRKASGAGLGLSICRGFVHAHGGDIWLEGVDKGTSIAFSLPINGQHDYA
jgi:PAS domain S-box-containing protein